MLERFTSLVRSGLGRGEDVSRRCATPALRLHEGATSQGKAQSLGERGAAPGSQIRESTQMCSVQRQEERHKMS